jgi:hypothetical protein
VRGAKAIASTRKFASYGDWHYFTIAATWGLTMMRDPLSRPDIVQRYWYDDRA